MAIFNKKSKGISKGFTLVELLVAMAMFLIVLTVVVQIFMTGLGGTRRLFGRQNSLDSARFILEKMSKEIRMSTIEKCDGGTCQNDTPYSTLSIHNPKLNQDLDYYFRSASSELRRDGDPLNAKTDVTITGKFYVYSPATISPPRVTIVMSVVSVGAKASQQVQVNLQTTVSSREYAQD